jgi:hypothetical protein
MEKFAASRGLEHREIFCLWLRFLMLAQQVDFTMALLSEHERNLQI